MSDEIKHLGAPIVVIYYLVYTSNLPGIPMIWDF